MGEIRTPLNTRLKKLRNRTAGSHQGLFQAKGGTRKTAFRGREKKLGSGEKGSYQTVFCLFPRASDFLELAFCTRGDCVLAS